MLQLDIVQLVKVHEADVLSLLSLPRDCARRLVLLFANSVQHQPNGFTSQKSLIREERAP